MTTTENRCPNCEGTGEEHYDCGEYYNTVVCWECRGTGERARPTVRTIALPPATHPVWTLGHAHVAVAHAICCAFLAFH